MSLLTTTIIMNISEKRQIILSKIYKFIVVITGDDKYSQ